MPAGMRSGENEAFHTLSMNEEFVSLPSLFKAYEKRLDAINDRLNANEASSAQNRASIEQHKSILENIVFSVIALQHVFNIHLPPPPQSTLPIPPKPPQQPTIEKHSFEMEDDTIINSLSPFENEDQKLYSKLVQSNMIPKKPKDQQSKLYSKGESLPYINY